MQLYSIVCRVRPLCVENIKDFTFILKLQVVQAAAAHAHCILGSLMYLSHISRSVVQDLEESALLLQCTGTHVRHKPDA